MNAEIIFETMFGTIKTWKAVNANRSRRQVRGLAIRLRVMAKAHFEHAPSVDMVTQILLREIQGWSGALTDEGAQRLFVDSAEALDLYFRTFAEEADRPLQGLPRDRG